MGDFVALCNRVNELQEKLYARQIIVEHINVGGGLGIDYAHPNRQAIPNFTEYFATLSQASETAPPARLTFRTGTCRSRTVRQPYQQSDLCKARNQQTVCHIRCRHDRLDSSCPLSGIPQNRKYHFGRPMETYDVVGPICESSDVFGKAIEFEQSTPWRPFRSPFSRSIW